MVKAFAGFIQDVRPIVANLQCNRDVRSKNVSVLTTHLVDKDTLGCAEALRKLVSSASHFGTVPHVL